MRCQKAHHQNMRQCFLTALSLAKYSINIASDIQIWHDGAWVANDIGGAPAVMVDIQSSLLPSAVTHG